MPVVAPQSNTRITLATGERISLADQPDGAQGHRKLRGIAYTGAPVARSFGSAIIDVAGVNLGESGQPIPLLLNHGIPFLNPSNAIPRIGFVGSVTKTDKDISIDAVMLGSNETSRGVIADAEAGYPFQLSISIDPLSSEEIKPGKTALVNGRTVAGPMTVIRQSRLREVSLVEIGADADTTTELLTRANYGASNMADSATAETIDLSKIPADEIRAARPELFRPEPEGPANFEQLTALDGGDTFVVSALKSKLTLTQARETLAAQLSQRLAVSESKIKELEEQLKLAKQAQGHAAVDTGTPQGTKTADGTFPGTLGQSPEQDWSLSIALQEHWKNNGGKPAYMIFAQQMQREGLKFNVPVNF